MAKLDGTEPIDPASRESAYAESRWPMAAAVVAAMVLTLLLPDDFRLAPRWVLPIIECLLLVTLITADPGRITRRSAALRAVSVALISVLALSAIWSTIQLIDDLIHGGPETSSASALLQAGGSVWASTILAFSLLYFELDSGGAAARAHHMPSTPELAFPQQLNPNLNAQHWRPRFIDYLYLGLTNSLALALQMSCRWRPGPRSSWEYSPSSHWASSGSSLPEPSTYSPKGNRTVSSWR